VVGRELGYGPHPGLWTRSQIEEVKLCLEQGLRKFYAPTILPGESYSHEWTFLRPLGQLTMESGKYQYDLPPEFAMISGPFTFAPDQNVLHWPIEIQGEEQLRYQRQWSESAGRPALAAIIPKHPDHGTEVGWSVTFWPTPDDDYTVHYRYSINPAGLNDDATLPIGGQFHAQTVLKACLTAAEEMKGIRDGLHSRAFLECLRASVGHDRKLNAPEYLGDGGDGSRRRGAFGGRFGDRYDCDESPVTYTGYNP